MFCPKCGTKNPEDGKFCRKCGTALVGISDSISGGSAELSRSLRRKKGAISWDSAMRKLFMGIAFLIVSIILGVTGAAGGQNWWYWMLIPAFSMIGAGIAQIIQIKSTPISLTESVSGSAEISEASQRELPPQQTDFVSHEPQKNYDTGDLVPPSVVENTTRHLELDKEGKTMTLPKKD